MSEWDINKPLGCCCATGRKIEPGEEYFGALVQTEQGLQRRDFCGEYWQREKPDVFCFWRTKLPEPNQKRQIFIDDDMLVAFFERLGMETSQESVNFRFALALVLMRKRRLKYDSTKSEGDREIWRLRTVGEDRKIEEVVNPHLNQEQIDQLSMQIGQILQTDL